MGQGKGKGSTRNQPSSAGSSREESKRKGREDEEVESVRDVRKKMDQSADLKIIVKFKEGNDISAISPTALTMALKKACGDIEMAKVLRDGRLLVKCKDSAQKEKVMKAQTICKKEIAEVRVFGEAGARGVISEVAREENVGNLKMAIKGVTVVNIKRLMANWDGVRVESKSLLLEFREKNLPERVMVGFISFTVREYIPPPLRCFKCQRFGHV